MTLIICRTRELFKSVPVIGHHYVKPCVVGAPTMVNFQLTRRVSCLRQVARWVTSACDAPAVLPPAVRSGADAKSGESAGKECIVWLSEFPPQAIGCSIRMLGGNRHIRASIKKQPGIACTSSLPQEAKRANAIEPGASLPTPADRSIDAPGKRLLTHMQIGCNMSSDDILRQVRRSRLAPRREPTSSRPSARLLCSFS